MAYSVYILASQRNGTLYVGMTNDLRRRVTEHKTGKYHGFTYQYDVTMLVYHEEYSNPHDAIGREKQLKWWRRKWKLELIESVNPLWKDLFDEL